MKAVFFAFLTVTFLIFTPAVHADTDVEFASGDLIFDRPTALGVYGSDQLSKTGQALDDLLGGVISRAIRNTGFAGNLGTFQLIEGAANHPILLVGAGTERTTLDIQELAGSIGQKAVSNGWSSIRIIVSGGAEASANIAFGAKLGSFKFDKYMQDDRKSKLESIIVHGPEDGSDIYNAEFASLVEGIFLARTFPSEPGNAIYPESFVASVEATIARLELPINITVLDENEIQDMGMGALYGVGRGSVRPPRLMVLEYNGGEEGVAPVVFAGKGITFDTGGISIKGNNGMWRMKYDLSAASSVMGTIIALAGRGAEVNAVGIAALAENMPGANAQRPGDVVETMSGKTIEIISTDAEGRLVLSDAVWYAQEMYNPDVLIDLATLTGSVRTAVGSEYSGLFTNSDTLAAQLTAAGQAAGEDVWRLPLHEKYRATIKSNFADIKNSGDGPGASIGAHVIEAFIQDGQTWAHLDIAGAGWNFSSTPMDPAGSPGYGVRLLNAWVKQYVENR